MKETETSEEEASPAEPKSEGGIYLAAGFLSLVLNTLAGSMAGENLPLLFPSFAFSLTGWIKAKGWAKRLLGVVLAGGSGGMFLTDLLVFLYEQGVAIPLTG